MFLKRLELYGFKTFADRTELELGPGITAIVGPNGSGKSNISDAILWVLGEQSTKALRSARSTDVIFKGSESRKALGMAEVNLTLDNEHGDLPIDYNEVTVTRCVFRSGESEYLINRTPVRLRDVHELFMDTGIGKHSYSIISQGEVDAVLSSRSEDRRALFEEVAGITKYKHRKKEALRKLEQTQQNLLRVSDIINELESQLEPMAAQSEKARQYQVLNAELTDLHLSLVVAQYQGLQGSLARSREREAELHQELEQLRHTLQQAEVKETTLRAALQQLEDELEERRGVENRLAAAVQGTESKLALLKQQEDVARKECERIERERGEGEQQAEALQCEIDTAEQEQARLQEIIAGLEGEIAAADDTLKEATAAVEAVAQQLHERRGAYLDALDQVAKVRNELARLDSMLKTSDGRLTRIAEERREVDGKLAARRAEKQTADARVHACKTARESLIARRNEVNAARQAAVEQQAEARQQEHRLREGLAGLRERQRTLQELEDSLEGYFPGVRAVMAAAQSGTLAGWYAPVTELINVPAELETAAEVALGANLQDVVTDGEQSAKAAISLLKRANAGRATFLPMDLISPAPRATVPDMDGVLGLFMDLVGYDHQHERVVQHIMGRVIVARDLDAALAAAKSPHASGWNRIVTLEGEVVHPSRAMTGGSKGRGSGLLTRKRELQELTEQLETLERKAQQAHTRYQEITAELQRLEGEVVRVAKQSEQAAAQQAEAERAVATVQRDVQALDERLGALDEETAWITREVEETRADHQRLLESLAETEGRQREAEQAIAEAEGTLAAEQRERDTVTERFAALRLTLTEVRGQWQTQQAAARRASEQREALHQRLQQHDSTTARLAEEIAQLCAKHTDAAAELERQRAALQKSGTDLEGARGRRTAMLEAIAASLEAQKALREQVEGCQDRVHRTDLRTTQIETELGFLETQFFEDYRLTTEQAIVRAKPVEHRGVAIARMKELQAAVDELGTVNLGAIEEYDRICERLSFLTAQRTDLEEGRASLLKVIVEIDTTCKEKFLEAFAAIAREFQDLFAQLFGGGTTQLTLEDPANVLESGIEIHVTIPGKRNQHLLQLSGGERALTALALLFAMLRVKPSPFVVLDEIDAPLDEANVGRYCDVLLGFTDRTQFLVVTHNKGTMEAADVLYGVTMEKAGVSKIIGVRLSDGQQTLPVTA
jgi:chromosome segregation protein